MVILKAIGAFFVKIWRWIKETAWVQPLLIVGTIFAVIFSIPYITRWMQSFAGEGNGQFFKNYDLSLQNERFVLGEVNSDADKMTQSLYEYTLKAYDDAQTKTTTANDYVGFTKQYGEKFFVVFYKEENTASNNIETGLKYLSEKWDNAQYNMSANDDTFIPFSLKAVNTSYIADNDNDEEIKLAGSPSAFQRYLYTNSNLFNVAGPELYKASYQTRASVSENSYDQFALNNTSSSTSDPLKDFPLPCVCLVDFTQKAISQGRAGLSEILFTVSGDSDLSRATLLLNMWNHTDDYSTTNLFTKQL